MTTTRRRTCRACDNHELSSVLDLGRQPLANALPTNAVEPDDTYPLELFLCGSCGLAQLLDVVDPSLLFGHYLYVSGTSPAMRSHWNELARDAAARVDLQQDEFVIEIASNDGTLLSEFQQLGARILGIEPAGNIVEIARKQGVPTHHAFFTSDVAAEVLQEHGKARIIAANNVLAHVDDPVGFLGNAASLLADDGVLITEVPFAGNMVRDAEYDTIYHEHLCYFSLSPLLTLFQRAGLRVIDVQDQTVHGGSVRVVSARGTGHDETVQGRANDELESGILQHGTWSDFAVRVNENRQKMQSLLQDIKTRGDRVWGYGSPAKASTLLNYCDIGPSLLEATADRSSLKVGRYVPGVKIPIRSVEELLEDQPDYVLILAWNLRREIRTALADLERRGTRFIVPHPTPTELTK